MKFFAVFAAVVAVACATPNSWTLLKVSEAIQNPTTRTELKPVLENALDSFMEGVFHGYFEGPIHITTAAGSVGTYTLSQLDAALQNPAIKSSVFEPYFEDALNKMMSTLFAGEQMESIKVQIPAFQLSYWSLHEIDFALSDAATNPKLIPYLENALDALMDDLINGGKQSSTVIAVPAEIVAPSPVVEPSPVAVAPVLETPVAPAPVAPVPTTPASSSPLVEIIINIQQASAPATPVIESPQVPVAPIVMPEPVAPIVVDPVHVVDVNPVPVNPIDVIAVNPMPVDPVDVVEENHIPVNPIDIIAVNPEPVNPIDVIAVMPVEALPVNPSPAVIGPM